MDNLDIRKEILLHLKDVKDIVNFLSIDKNQLCHMTDWKYIYNQHHYEQLINHLTVKNWIIDYKFMQYFMALANYNIDQYNILLQFFKNYVPGHMERKVINFVFDTDDFDDFVYFLHKMTDQQIKNHLQIYSKYSIVYYKNSVSDFWNNARIIIKNLTGGDTIYTRCGEKLPDTNFIIITNQSHEHEPIMQHRITTIHLKHKPYTDFFTEEEIHILKRILS
jgi:hypothetical protein